MVRVVSLYTTEISEKTRLEVRYSGCRYLKFPAFQRYNSIVYVGCLKKKNHNLVMPRLMNALTPNLPEHDLLLPDKHTDINGL